MPCCFEIERIKTGKQLRYLNAIKNGKEKRNKKYLKVKNSKLNGKKTRTTKKHM